MNKYRVLRVIEYIGDRDSIISCLDNSLQGTKKLKDFEIRVATIGNYPELLEEVENG